jgi:hypothetical protein
MEHSIRTRSETDACRNLSEVMNLCCESLPQVTYDREKDVFIVRCLFCPMEEQDASPVGLMTKWNKAVRKVKGL